MKGAVWVLAALGFTLVPSLSIPNRISPLTGSQLPFLFPRFPGDRDPVQVFVHVWEVSYHRDANMIILDVIMYNAVGRWLEATLCTLGENISSEYICTSII